MLHHRTKNPQDRAFDIAEREAETVYRKTGDYTTWTETLVSIFNAALLEISGKFPVSVPPCDSTLSDTNKHT